MTANHRGYILRFSCSRGCADVDVRMHVHMCISQSKGTCSAFKAFVTRTDSACNGIGLSDYSTAPNPLCLSLF